MSFIKIHSLSCSYITNSDIVSFHYSYNFLNYNQGNCRLPLDVLPGVGLILGAALRSVALARRLLKPYFARKEMTPYEQELFIQERSFELRCVFKFI